jgi:predicted transcriptional regulator of viral defense system
MAKLVNWAIFERKLKVKSLVIFTPLDVRRIFGVSKVAATFLVYRYAKRGLIVRLKRGLYSLSDMRAPDLYVANKLYEPSYVSLEFALSYHGLIPETVYGITSVTTKTTQKFTALGKVFTYRRIKREAFTGYNTARQRNFTFLIAEPEKALVDLTYLRMLNGKRPISRFAKEKINARKALQYATLFSSNKLIRLIKTTLR